MKIKSLLPVVGYGPRFAFEAVSKEQTDKYGRIAGEQIWGALFRVGEMIENPDPPLLTDKKWRVI